MGENLEFTRNLREIYEKKTSEVDLGVVKDKGGGEQFLNMTRLQRSYEVLFLNIYLFIYLFIFYLRKKWVSAKPEGLLPLRSILSVPALGVFLVTERIRSIL